MQDVVIGVDLGGTRIRSARFDAKLAILERQETLTLAHEGLDATVGRIKTMIERVLPEDRSCVRGIGFSAPGPLNPRTGVVVAPPNLAGWHHVPLAEILQAHFDLPVYVGNDANVAALAETMLGAARGCRYVIYLTISTGIGSGIIDNGRLVYGVDGLGAEAGHLLMLQADGSITTLEQEAAGPALLRHARRRIEAGEASLLQQMCANDLDKLTGSMLGQAVADGDPLALSIIERAGTLVGIGIVNLLLLFNPEIVVLGGGVTDVGEPLFAPLRRAVQQYARDEAYQANLRIVPAGLGEDTALIGAAALALAEGGQDTIAALALEIAR
jgi:glucokinase